MVVVVYLQWLFLDRLPKIIYDGVTFVVVVVVVIFMAASCYCTAVQNSNFRRRRRIQEAPFVSAARRSAEKQEDGEVAHAFLQTYRTHMGPRRTGRNCTETGSAP